MQIFEESARINTKNSFKIKKLIIPSKATTIY